MEKITISGEVYHIGQTEQVSEKFKKREFVIQTKEEKFPQLISLQMTQDKVDLLDNLSIGDNVECNINLRGREWTDRNGVKKFFNTIEAWSIQLKNISNSFEQKTFAQLDKKDELPAPDQKRPLTDLFDPNDEFPL
jgi:translation initiation factor IF-3